MGLIKFKDLPDKTTPLDADSLNNNFSYGVPVGGIVLYPGTTAPDGFLMCDGSEISREKYSELFAILGTTFGSGDETTTFNLPKFNGRIPVGSDETDSDFNTIGKTGGEKTHTLTYAEMPKHAHSILGNPNTGSIAGTSYNATIVGNDAFGSTAITSEEGSNRPHNIMQPYIVMNYIIKY